MCFKYFRQGVYILRLAKHRIAQIISTPLIALGLELNIYSYRYMFNDIRYS